MIVRCIVRGNNLSGKGEIILDTREVSEVRSENFTRKTIDEKLSETLTWFLCVNDNTLVIRC